MHRVYLCSVSYELTLVSFSHMKHVVDLCLYLFHLWNMSCFITIYLDVDPRENDGSLGGPDSGYLWGVGSGLAEVYVGRRWGYS
jgi:hypothetical protein